LDSDGLDFSGLTVGPGVTVDLASTAKQTVHTFWNTSLCLTLSSASGIENVSGTPHADIIKGNGRDNSLSGYGGNDELYGYFGNDKLYGGSENDKLYPGVGTNTVSDGPGDDVVDLSQNAVGIVYVTGVGNDPILGDPGAGNDVVYGTPFVDKITGSS